MVYLAAYLELAYFFFLPAVNFFSCADPFLLPQKINPVNSDIGIIVCDAKNENDIKSMVSQAKICVSFVGPYRVFGEPILKACVEAGTDYVDATGEPPFFNEMTDKYHESASAKKLYVLPASFVVFGNKAPARSCPATDTMSLQIQRRFLHDSRYCCGDHEGELLEGQLSRSIRQGLL
jgi:hypothetical protein